MGDLLVEMTDISKSFPGVLALDGARFELRPGEVHALVGENGAGKSTLMKVLGGIYRRDAGTIRVKGQEVEINSPRAAQDLGISIIHQELNLMGHLTVAQNIFIGREPRRRRASLDEKALNRKTAELFEELHLHLDPTARVSRLAVAQQQMVEIAKALSFNSDVLIMDEPTAALTETEIEELFRITRHLRERGHGIVHISHRLEELKQITDRVTVMRDGRYVDTVNTAEASIQQIISMMVGRTIFEATPELPETVDPDDRARGERPQPRPPGAGRQLPAPSRRDPRRRRPRRGRPHGGDARHLRRRPAGVRHDHDQWPAGHHPHPERCGPARDRLPVRGSQALRPGARHGRRGQHRPRVAEPRSRTGSAG